MYSVLFVLSLVLARLALAVPAPPAPCGTLDCTFESRMPRRRATIDARQSDLPVASDGTTHFCCC